MLFTVTMTLVFVLFAGFELFSPWSVLFILRCTASSILSENFVEVFPLMDVFRVSRCSTCPRTIFVCWSSLGSVTGTAIMCPQGRLGVKPGTAYGAFDRWRQSVLEASPPGGVLWAVVMGKSDSHSFTFPWQGHLSPPICWGGEYLLLCLKWFLTNRAFLFLLAASTLTGDAAVLLDDAPRLPLHLCPRHHGIRHGLRLRRPMPMSLARAGMSASAPVYPA